MQAAFFDLDKTIISRSSSLALSRPLFRAGMVTRSQLLRGAYAQLVYLLVGADENKMEQLKEGMLSLTRGWDRGQIERLVEEVIFEVIDPYVYQEALDLMALHRSEGRRIYIVSSSPEEVVRPLARHFGVNGVIATRPGVDDAGPVHGGARVLRVRRAEGGSDPQPRRAGGDRSRGVVRLQRLDHRPADARRRGPPGRGQRRQGASSRGRGARLADPRLPPAGAHAHPTRVRPCRRRGPRSRPRSARWPWPRCSSGSSRGRGSSAPTTPDPGVCGSSRSGCRFESGAERYPRGKQNPRASHAAGGMLRTWGRLVPRLPSTCRRDA